MRGNGVDIASSPCTRAPLVSSVSHSPPEHTICSGSHPKLLLLPPQLARERAALVVVLFLVVRGRSCLLYVRAGARIDQSEPTQAREMSVTLATRHKNSPENLLLTRARFLRQQYKRKVSKKRAKMYITRGIIHRTATLRI